MGIGTLAMGLLALSVIFTVIMRYCFSLSWKEVSEFNITLFAFTTFWGLGVCILRNEHVVIDMLYNKLCPPVKRCLSVLNYGIVLAVDLIFLRYSWAYARKAGVQISQGMEIPMIFMYGIMPVCALIAAACIVIRIVEFIRAPLSFFETGENGDPQRDGAEEKER